MGHSTSKKEEKRAGKGRKKEREHPNPDRQVGQNYNKKHVSVLGDLKTDGRKAKKNKQAGEQMGQIKVALRNRKNKFNFEKKKEITDFYFKQ